MREFGLRDVLVIEKSPLYGGTSATSGGGIWIPCSRYAKAAGAADSLDAARRYLQATIPAGLVPDVLLDTYLEQGPRMLDFLHERTRVRYKPRALPGLLVVPAGCAGGIARSSPSRCAAMRSAMRPRRCDRCIT